MALETNGQSGQVVVAYLRVSSADQNEARQLAAVGAVNKVFIDRASGKSTERAQLQAMLAYVREGDVVRVKSADRLARSTTDLLGLIEALAAKGVQVEFTDHPSLSTTSAHGTFMLTILGAVAELERATIRERQAEGIALAKARGVYARNPKLSAEQIEAARVAIESRGVPVARVALDLGVSRQTLYNALNGVGRYAAL
ncbi:recombinase family protein [Demequina phytophila]|uniref:recombinase family protein n=1 Tax=Demequina phytophila TaxID=1638981 RepID=UPI000780528A|nr:recombinase family protein [Demequina phytophila]